MKSLKLKRNEKCKPNDIQYNVIKNIETFYKKNNIGKFIAACGVGKTLTSLFISKIIKSNSIIIGVPYTNLLEQWEKEIKKIYPELSILIVGGNGTTNNENINSFIKLNKDKIIITTYSSSNNIQKIVKENNIIFDFKIGDEAHHLARGILIQTWVNTKYFQNFILLTGKIL